MSTTTLLQLALPEGRAGLSVTSSSTSWAYGTWVTAATHTNNDIYITDLVFQVTNVPVADTTTELIFNIGIGQAGSEVVKAQVPYSFRSDTAVAYYLDTYVFNFPEPFLVPALSRVAVRVANGLASAITYDGVKIRYMSSRNLIQLATGAYSNNYKRIIGGGTPMGVI